MKAVHVSMTAGAVMLVAALVLGFVGHANPALVYTLLGLATLLFGLVVLIIMQPGLLTLAGLERPPPAAPAAGTSPAIAAKGDLPMRLGTTLGEILMVAVRNDPEGAARIFAGPANHGEVPAATTAAPESKG